MLTGLVGYLWGTGRLNKPKVQAIADDPKDNMVLECADAAKADIIISGDAHLLELKQWESIRIGSPAGFIKEIGSQHGVARYGARPRRL